MLVPCVGNSFQKFILKTMLKFLATTWVYCFFSAIVTYIIHVLKCLKSALHLFVRFFSSVFSKLNGWILRLTLKQPLLWFRSACYHVLLPTLVLYPAVLLFLYKKRWQCSGTSILFVVWKRDNYHLEHEEAELLTQKIEMKAIIFGHLANKLTEPSRSRWKEAATFLTANGFSAWDEFNYRLVEDYMRFQ